VLSLVSENSRAVGFEDPELLIRASLECGAVPLACDSILTLAARAVSRLLDEGAADVSTRNAGAPTKADSSLLKNATSQPRLSPKNGDDGSSWLTRLKLPSLLVK